LASRSTDPLAALSWISRLWRLRPETMLGAAVAAACSRDGRQEQEQEERERPRVARGAAPARLVGVILAAPGLLRRGRRSEVPPS